MPMIYKRFTEKASEEWRQIYKVLQTLNGTTQADSLGFATPRIPDQTRLRASD